MDLDEARDFLRQHHRAVLYTRRGNGAPQLSPVLVGVDEHGQATVSTREPSMKVVNIRDDPRVSLCVFTDEFFGPWVRVDGRAEVVSLPAAMDGLVAQYRQLAGQHDDWDEFRRTMVDEQRVLLRVEIQAAGPDRAG